MHRNEEDVCPSLVFDTEQDARDKGRDTFDMESGDQNTQRDAKILTLKSSVCFTNIKNLKLKESNHLRGRRNGWTHPNC